MLCSLFPSTFVSFGQEAKKEYSATTISDPQIPVEDLELLLKPLAKSELIVEADAWLQLLKEKVTEISTLEIQMRQKSRQTDEKQEQTLVNINKLREQQSALVEWFNVVVTALKNKGGEVEEYEKYAAAISGFWVKTDDYWNVYWDVTRAVKERFDAEGISIPFPQKDLHLYKTGG